MPSQSEAPRLGICGTHGVVPYTAPNKNKRSFCLRCVHRGVSANPSQFFLTDDFRTLLEASVLTEPVLLFSSRHLPGHPGRCSALYFDHLASPYNKGAVPEIRSTEKFYAWRTGWNTSAARIRTT